MPTTSSAAIPIPATAMRYRDVATASDWLCQAFGFEKQTVLADDNGAPLYVQLTFGRAMLMLAPVRPSPIDSYMKQPDEIGGAETQSGYYVVADADAHYARAKAAGATIVLDIEDDDFGGRTYTCRDPEGHIWTFGSYDPWQGKFPEAAPAPAATAAAPPARGFGRRLARTILLLACMAGTGVAGWYAGSLIQPRAAGLAAHAPTPAVLERRAALEAAEQAARRALVELEGERAARAAADKASEQAQLRAAEEARAREAAEGAVKEARAELEKLEAAKAAAAAGTADLVRRMEEERGAREAAERAVKEARAELEKLEAAKAAAAAGAADLAKRVEEERRAREAAELALKQVRAELEAQRAVKPAAAAGDADPGRRAEEERRAREAAELALKQVRAELEKARSDRAAAELAKDFALNRAEEEQAARAAAERAAKEARDELDRKLALSTPVAGGPPPEVLKGTAEMQRALDDAKKRATAAETAVAEVREQLAKERASKNAAWKVVGQLTRQLRAAKTGADGFPEEPPPAKKAKTRPKKKAPEPE